MSGSSWFVIMASTRRAPRSSSVQRRAIKSATATSYTPVDGATYQVTSYLSDYYLPTASNGLNSTSNITKAITGCMKNPGGEGSYMAGAMYAAESSLIAAQTASRI